MIKPVFILQTGYYDCDDEELSSIWENWEEALEEFKEEAKSFGEEDQELDRVKIRPGESAYYNEGYGRYVSLFKVFMNCTYLHIGKTRQEVLDAYTKEIDLAK
jgi:hypothetical protein